MSDIFLSYAREDRATAEVLANAFEDHGWSVWWDRELVIGTSYEFRIEEELAAAKCVVVLWSTDSVKSEWVRNEAGDGNDRDILVPVRVARVKPPLAFRGLQTADLLNWRGDVGHPGFRDLCLAIAGKTGRPAAVPAGADGAPRPAPPPTPPWRGRSRAPLAIVAVVALVAVVGFGLIQSVDGGDGGEEERSVTVESDVEWTAAVDLRDGETVEITARGEIDTATDQPGRTSGPDGIDGEENHPNNVISGVAHAALIGKLGEHGRPMAVGSHSRYTAPTDGVLYLGVNDRGVENNGGAFDVTVTRTSG